MLRMIAGVVLLAGAVVSAAAPAGPEVNVTETDGLYTVSASFTVLEAAPFAFATLTDYERIPRFMPEVRVSAVLGRDKNHAVVRQEAVARFMMFSRRIHLVLDVYEAPGTIRFSDRSGKSFSRYEGVWTLDERDGVTHMTYVLSAKPSFDVPSVLLKRLLTRDANRMIGHLTAEIAARARQAPH